MSTPHSSHEHWPRPPEPDDRPPRRTAVDTARLWLIEDSALESQRALAVLGDAFVVETFEDAALALERLAQRAALPQLVLLDWHMPGGLSGLEVCRFLRERYDEVTLPILVLTASTRSEDRHAALEAGANDFVGKPFEPTELLARVRTLVRVARLAEALRQREAEAARAVVDARASQAVSDSALHDVQAVTAALHESEARLQLTLAGSGIGTFEADPATGRITFDARMREVVNLGPDELLDMDRTLAQVHPEERDQVAQAFARTLTEGVPYRIEHRVLPRPGQVGDRWVAASGAALQGPDGRVTRLVGTGTDITEQVEARRRIEESEQRFRLIANALPQIVWTATADFHVDWYNDWWFEYLGLPRGTRWDDPDTAPMHPEDVERTRHRLREAVGTGRDFSLEQRFRRGSDGEYRWHLVRAVAIRGADGRILKWVGANTDIHDQKQLTENLEQERELRERFVATLSHDLRTPLQAARLNAQLLARRGHEPAILLRSAARITDALDRADAMIRDMLDASRVRAGEGLRIEASELDLTALAQDTLEELSLVHGERFVLEAPGELRGAWSGSGLRRVLENLCTNAIKYGAHDRPVTVRLAEDGADRVTLAVHNWGPPIPAADLPGLFRDYHRAGTAEAGPQRGWGLGLTVVEGLARAHRGTVRAESSAEAGTTFTVTLARDLRA